MRVSDALEEQPEFSIIATHSYPSMLMHPFILDGCAALYTDKNEEIQLEKAVEKDREVLENPSPQVKTPKLHAIM